MLRRRHSWVPGPTPRREAGRAAMRGLHSPRLRDGWVFWGGAAPAAAAAAAVPAAGGFRVAVGVLVRGARGHIHPCVSHAPVCLTCTRVSHIHPCVSHTPVCLTCTRVSHIHPCI